MKHVNRWMVVILLIVAALPLAACSQTSAGATAETPAIVEPIEGTELNRVILTEKAAQRLDIQTAPVSDEPDAAAAFTPDGGQMIVPYSAVIYGLNGETWVYVNPEPLTYERHAVTVEFIEGDMAVLSDGPPAGAEVVTVGVAELYGADTGIGK